MKNIKKLKTTAEEKFMHLKKKYPNIQISLVPNENSKKSIKTLNQEASEFNPKNNKLNNKLYT